MKPKHYPHVTLAAAILLLLLPASLLVLIPGPQGTSADEILAAVDEDLQQIQPSEATDRPENLTPSAQQRPATRVAMLPDVARDQPGVFQSGDANLYTSTEPMSRVSVATTPSISPPVNNKLHASTSALSETVIADETELDAAIVSAAPGVPEIRSEEDLEREETLSKELEATLAQGPTTRESYFQSTGHLAMTGTISSKSSVQNTKRKRRSGSSGRSKETKRTDEPAMSGTMPTSGTDDPFASEPSSPVVDVVLQQPFEQRPVQKVENLIATTQEPGWPIALVRSDIPGDAWWVQQMVGIRHRSFASRVNFGNNDSLPGSVYHLVIVFLDSADEARRFRIAKQFKEIPEGLRRSREYTFVRK